MSMTLFQNPGCHNSDRLQLPTDKAQAQSQGSPCGAVNKMAQGKLSSNILVFHSKSSFHQHPIYISPSAHKTAVSRGSRLKQDSQKLGRNLKIALELPLNQLVQSTSIIKVVKSRRLQRTGHITQM